MYFWYLSVCWRCSLAEAHPSLEVVTSIITASFNVTKEFCNSHRLIINPAKTQLIIFTAAGNCIPQDFHLILDNCTQITVKLLGVTLDQHLTFDTQIDNAVSKCQGLLGMLARATPYLPIQLLKLSSTALIHSHLEYCSSFYSSVAKTHLKELDVIQKKSHSYHRPSTLLYSRWTTSGFTSSWCSQQQKREALCKTDWIVHLGKLSPSNEFVCESATG